MRDESGRGAAHVDVDRDAVLDALPRAIVVTTPDGRILSWNRRAEQFYGWRADEVIGRTVSDVLVPAPGKQVGAEILRTVAGGGTWEGDFTVAHRDGSPLQAWVWNRPILDNSGTVIAIVGASEDVTERRRLEQRAADLAANLRLALDAGELGTFRWDTATATAEWDTKLEALIGFEPGTFPGTFDAWVAAVHPEDIAEVVRAINAATEARGRYEVEHRVVWPDGTIHWLHGAGRMTTDDLGNVTGAVGCVRDITAARDAARILEQQMHDAVDAAEQERISRQRLEFLTRVNDALAAARDRPALMASVTRAAIPHLCDWCSLFVLPGPDARMPDIETAHVDPAMAASARELQERFGFDPDAPAGMPHVIRTGNAEFYPTINEAVIDGLNAAEADRDLLRGLAPRSAIVVPLIKKGRILGGMQFVMSESSRRYTEDDLLLAQAVAARIAASLENLRLSEEQRKIASTLQSALLPPELPDIPGVEVAVRYWATGEGIDVGGDFYDVFTIDDGWAVVIGDVCGTGPGAAAVTGMVRHTIASAAWNGDDHAVVLDKLNRAMRQRNAGPFCTAIYGTVRPSAGETIFTFASGGHPLPLLVSPDEDARIIGAGGRLIGVFDELRVVVTRTVLHPGDTVVLYTDGATDVAPPYGLSHEEFARLVGRAARSSHSAEHLADRLHEALSSILGIDERDDDIALLILRVPPAASVPVTSGVTPAA